MISFILGKPGGGKTLFSVHKAVEMLVQTDCVVISNVAFELGELNAYIQRKHPEADIDIHSRVKILDREEVPEFFRHRAGGLVLPEPPDLDERGKKLPIKEFNRQMDVYFTPMNEREEYRQPVFYIIDETHDFFNARDWASTGRYVLFYMSKHRHLGDEIFLITQHLDQCEKQLRNLGEQFHNIRNFYHRSWGLVKARGRFRRDSYNQPPLGNAKPYEKSSFQLDAAGVAKCYKTRGALGVIGTTEQRKPVSSKWKLPWWSVWLGSGVAVCAFVFALWKAPQLMGDYFASMSGTVSDKMLGKDSTSKAVSSGSSVLPSQDLVAAIEEDLSDRLPPYEKKAQPRFYRRFSVIEFRGQKIVTVELDNGAIVTSDDPFWDGYDDQRRVQIGGIVFCPPSSSMRSALVGTPGHDGDSMPAQTAAEAGMGGIKKADSAPPAPDFNPRKLSQSLNVQEKLRKAREENQAKFR